MRTKEFYQSKIRQAEFDIQIWKLKIEELENPVIGGDSSTPTKVVSIRVPKEKAAAIKKAFITFVMNNNDAF